MRTALAVFLVAGLLLSGCSGKSNESSSTTGTSTSSSGSASGTTTASGSGTGTGTTTSGSSSSAGNHAPTIASFAPNVGAGIAPLAVNFTFVASDADKDTLSWTIDFADGTPASGTGPSGQASHTYAAAGNFTARLVVTDGKLSANKTALIKVEVAGPGPQVYEGKWTAGGPVGCEQIADGDDFNQMAPQLEGVDFVTFPIQASSAGMGFTVAIKATAPGGAYEVDFYDAGGANLGYVSNGYDSLPPTLTSSSIAGVAPADAASAVFFACTGGGGTFTFSGGLAVP